MALNQPNEVKVLQPSFLHDFEFFVSQRLHRAQQVFVSERHRHLNVVKVPRRQSKWLVQQPILQRPDIG